MVKRLSLLALLLIQGVVYAQTPVQRLEQAYQALMADPQTKYAITSVCVLDANTGTLLFGRNQNVGLSTASTLKTITSATAFSLLGKDFRYETALAYTGNIQADGLLKGDLVIVGGGDPTLGSWRYAQSKEGTILTQWVKAIKEAGIRKIEGHVIGDDGLWGSQTTPDGWTWQDMGNYYGAGASALSWRENQFDIHLKAYRADSKVTILKTVPEMPYLTLVNELKPGAAGSGDNVYAYLPALGTTAYLRGTWATGIAKSGISAALPDPAFDAAFRLQDTLQHIGIPVSEAPETTRQLTAGQRPLPKITQKINTISSPSLTEIVFWFNKKSVNLYGEHLLKTLAWKAGKDATTKNGAATVINYWASKGMDKAALNIIDGSGLSPATRVTTFAMASILFQAQKESWFPVFYESLPENNGMKLKSGTIADVSAYAGYYTSNAGQKYIIVINSNNYSGSGISRKLFRVLDALK
ncbi:D-alanyl-D-alanine carboxypeptidase/D-alanyl-D-alanine endopeptidase [Pedobacter metabolipauper]|uniref:D-alanyl-D-alanine carboxypeptidase/D-alanyl-D-alanine-endopeptidase (Penicillin-binding protein 4) n=1 Tax=Pedobacter metabolipauper TaxID=425513 RepID=A0A4R6SXX4_9SPHI|nr:D-alanyl-D-alanine carboxypeptidase/D-alanyl-D-alanine-endopeptidase [Pedobacter metabolipauper]TDQ10326.1 D-alanyl-D-alanine carboxypeptidase/D-alanyl-D-alanine-endopeptidase (penicillin-binding protein 4) [Pedobacter metabolipauper]